ncbi:MAG: GxxExxY protein [Candidatus Levybacteria bacterium]|nr:GxxExxY protein [Candidatus Levybacteria bacterium]
MDDDKIGKYSPNFLIDHKIVLELKTVPRLLPIHYRQVRSYLKTNNLKLGILVNFRGSKVQYKRILNGNATE